MLRIYILISFLFVLLSGCSTEPFNSHPLPAVSEAQDKMEAPKQDTQAAISVSEIPYKMTIGGKTIDVKASILGNKP